MQNNHYTANYSLEFHLKHVKATNVERHCITDNSQLTALKAQLDCDCPEAGLGSCLSWPKLVLLGTSPRQAAVAVGPKPEPYDYRARTRMSTGPRLFLPSLASPFGFPLLDILTVSYTQNV